MVGLQLKAGEAFVFSPPFFVWFWSALYSPYIYFVAFWLYMLCLVIYFCKKEEDSYKKME